MKLLTLNCQHGDQSLLKDFLSRTLNAEEYDFLLLQEVNEKVMAFLKNPAYEVVRPFNGEIGQSSQLCIAYRKHYLSKGTGFRSFASMRKDPVRGFKHPCFGIFYMDFEIDKKIWRIATTHLHSGMDSNIRIAESRLAKEVLLTAAPEFIMIAGDFNAGLPYERGRIAQLFSPELAWGTKTLGPTLDSRYSENVAHFPNRIAALLRIFHVGIQLRTDHIFVNRRIMSDYAIQCHVLPDRVSDHSPVEFTVENMNR